MSNSSHDRRRAAAYAACSTLIAMGARAWPAPMNTGTMHGPALLTYDEMLRADGFNATEVRPDGYVLDRAPLTGDTRAL